MTIAVECPHCETRFRLQPDLAGKAMRCPNSSCREVFEVRPLAPDEPAARPGQRSGAVAEFVPVLEAEVAPPPAPTRGAFGAARRAPKPAEQEVVEAVVVAPPPVKEVVWSADADVPPPPRRGPVKAEAADDGDDLVVRRRKKSRGPLVLAVLGVLTVLTAGIGGVFIFRYQALAESRAAAEAEQQYAGAEYAKAGRSYDDLATKYAGGRDAETYRFFADLAAVRLVVGSVTTKENPRPALDAFRAFVEARKGTHLAKPEQRGFDIFDAGKKLADDVVTFAQDRVKAFAADRTKPDELRQAEEMIAAGRDLGPLVEPFRPPAVTPLDVAARLDGVQAAVGRERARLDAIARARAALADPTDRAIQDVTADLAAAGLAADAEAVGLLAQAEADFLRRVRYDPDPAAPLAALPAGTPSLLVVAPVGPVRPPARTALDDPPAVFLAVARGVLAALDEDTGDLLWAARVGPDATDPPAVARVESADGPTDLAVVVSNVAGQPAVTGTALRSGAVRWRQSLPAPAAGAAAVVGARAFVPVRDAAGSVLVFDLTSGARVGRLTLGQPVGPAATARAGVPELYVAAEARRVFVFDVQPGGDPRCVRVIPTGHPAGTLRTAPTLLGPAGDDPAPRWLVLSQADGPTAMRLRAFPLPANGPLAADAAPVSTPVSPAADLALPGWAWFPPVSDGERLAVVTDAGQFRLFGINQPGNNDTAIFPLPHPTLAPPPAGNPMRGLVVPAEEGAFWVLAGGTMRKFRLTLLPDRGLAMVSAGNPVPVGEPTQPAQLTPRRDVACFVVGSQHAAGCRAVAVRLADGEPRWQRQLGVMPAAAPLPVENGLLLVDEAGGATVVPTGAALAPGVAKAADGAVAPGVDAVTGPTLVAASADGRTVFTVTPARPADAAVWVVRRVVAGKVEHGGTVTAPAALAGSPVVLNGMLLLPAADGFVYRLTPGDGRAKPDALAPGPRWWIDRKEATPTCYLTAAGDDAFLSSDGGRNLVRWVWPAGGAWTDGAARWDGRERVAAPPLVVPAAGGRAARLLVADATGGVFLYALDRGDAPLRRWVPGRTPSLPGGKVSAGFGLHTDPAGRQTACYVVDGTRLVALDVDRDDPRWVVGLGDDAGAAAVGVPHPAADGRWLVTTLGGRVAWHDGETGAAGVTREVGLPGAVPATAGVPAGGGRVLVPLSDGTAAVVEFAPVAPEPKAKE